MKTEDWKHYKLSGSDVSIILVISIAVLVVNHLGNSIGQGQEEGEQFSSK
jgi:hypothetical protein